MIAGSPQNFDLLVLDIGYRGGGRRLVRVDPDTGVVSDVITELGDEPSGRNYSGVDISPGGETLLVTEKGNGRILVFTLDGDGDGTSACDIGAVERQPGDRTTFVYLPLVLR